MSGAPAPASAPEPRCRFIEHQGKQILFHDLSNITNPSDGFPVIAQSKAIIARQPRASVLTLTHVANSRFNKELVEGLTDLAKHNKPT